MRDLGKALQSIAAKEKPLVLYLFSREQRVKERVLRETAAGTRCVRCPRGDVRSVRLAAFERAWRAEVHPDESAPASRYNLAVPMTEGVRES